MTSMKTLNHARNMQICIILKKNLIDAALNKTFCSLKIIFNIYIYGTIIFCNILLLNKKKTYMYVL